MIWVKHLTAVVIMVVVVLTLHFNITKPEWRLAVLLLATFIGYYAGLKVAEPDDPDDDWP